MNSSSFPLDQRILYNIIFPIVIVMGLVSLFRTRLHHLLFDRKFANWLTTHQTQILGRSTEFRQWACLLTKSQFSDRQRFFTDNVQGQLFLLGQDPPPNENSGSSDDMFNQMSKMSDSSMMFNSLKNNASMIFQQLFIYSWINYFFSGYVVLRLPFSLPPVFRQMLQSGVNLTSLNVQYVSSLSWYFLTFFGLQGIIDYFFGQQTTQLMATQQQFQMAPAATAAKPHTRFHAEYENIKLVNHQFLPADSVQRALYNFKR